MHREEEHRFWLGLLLALLLVRALRALSSTLFYQSLATLRLNTSAFWLVVLVAPVAAAWLGPRGLRASVAVVGAATAALGLARFTSWYVPLAALASAAGLLALVRGGLLAGAAAGLALDAALHVLGRSVDPLPGVLAPILLGGLALVVAWRTQPLPLERGGWVAGGAAAALVAVELAYLASPYALGRWTGTPAWVAAAASGVGLLVGATRLRHAGTWLWAVGALALVDVAFARSPLAPLSIALLQCALGAAAARLAPRLPTVGAGVTFGLVFAPLTFFLVFFPTSLGTGEWTLLVPVLALAAVAPAALAPRPRRARAHVGAAPAAVLLAMIALAAALPSPIAPPSDDAITLVSWNVHQGFGNRGGLDPDIYVEVLRELDPDIVLLQESETARLSGAGMDLAQLLAHELGMHAAYGRSGSSVLSRFPLADEPRPSEEDWSLEVPLDVRGETLWARSVHLARGRDPAARDAQVEALLADPHGPHHVLAGDLNSCPAATCFGGRPSDGVYERLTARYHDAWLEAGGAPDDRASMTHPARNPVRRIDHVLVEGIEVLSSRVLLDERTRAASDHLPVVVELRLAAR